VNFRETFPVTAWFWRRATSPRSWRNALLGLAGFIIVTGIAFRIDDALFAARVTRIVHSLADIKVDATTEDELVRLIPALKNADGAPWCGTEHCYSITEENPSWTERFWAASRFQRGLQTAFYYWGFPARRFTVGIRIHSERVSGLFYHVMLMSVDPPDPMSPVLLAGATTSHNLDNYTSQVADDQSPEYSIEFRLRQTLFVQLTPLASRELARHAFEIDTACIWSLLFCRKPEQLLPAAFRDQTQISEAALRRLQGAEPCPVSIVKRRVRDGFQIALLELVNVEPGITPDWNHEPHRDASVRLIQVFQKHEHSFFDRPEADAFFDHLSFPLTQTDSSIYPARVPNPVINTLKPGNRYLWFYEDRGRFGTPCEMIPATDAAMTVLAEALRQHETKAP
jgi:hypothetical protein